MFFEHHRKVYLTNISNTQLTTMLILNSKTFYFGMKVVFKQISREKVKRTHGFLFTYLLIPTSLLSEDNTHFEVIPKLKTSLYEMDKYY